MKMRCFCSAIYSHLLYRRRPVLVRKNLTNKISCSRRPRKGLSYDASSKVVFLTRQSFEYKGQTQVEILMTHPVYPARVGCDPAPRLFPQL